MKLASKPANVLYEFGSFRLNPGERVLLRNEELVPLPPKAFDTLLVFVEHGGHVLSKDELLSRIWPDTVVEEGNLTQHIHMLRKALAGTSDRNFYIETIPKRGYRFAATARKVEPAGADARLRSIAVLPFTSLTTHGSEDYLGIVIANALITKLSNVRQISVRPTSAVVKYAEQGHDPVAAGRELAVDAILDGSVERADDRIRVTVQLIRMSDGTTSWANQVDEKFNDIFTMEDSISEQVTRALMLELTTEERRELRKRHTENAEAYQAYLKGRYFWDKRTEKGLRKSIEYFEVAFAADPGYALAYGGLAEAYFLLGFYCVLPPEEAFPKANVAAVNALNLDDNLAEAHGSLGYVKVYFYWDWEGAEREFKRALQINPNYATAHQWYSLYLCAVGRFDEALKEVTRAAELDPLSLIISTNVGATHYFSGQYDRAIEQYQKTLEMDANFALGHWHLGSAYLQKGWHQKAILELNRAVTLSKRSPLVLAALGHAYALSGKRDKARKVLDELIELSTQRYISPYDLATIYAGLGEHEQAFAGLEEAFNQRSGRLFLLDVEPVWNDFRSDPRFAGLIKRLGIVR